MRRWVALSLGLVLVAAAAAPLGAATATPPTATDDLLSVYERAVANDPQIREADANRLAARESKPQAFAALLPQLSGSAAYGKDKLDGLSLSTFVLNGVLTPSNRSGNGDTTTKRWSVDLRQNVFSWTSWVALKRADHQVAQAEADYQAAQQDLISRVATRYFDVLAAQDSVEAQQSAFDSISRQLEQADKRFEVGLIAITDVQEAKAARDAAAAAVIAAKRQLATTEELLREYTAEKYSALAKPANTMPLKSPEPADEQKWVDVSMEQNSSLLSSRLGADIARDNVRSAFGGHLPSVELVASRGNSRSDSTTKLTSGAISSGLTNQDDTSYTVQLSVPIFSGGATQSIVRQSEYLWQAARERYTRVSRQTERQARDAYLGVNSEISRVQALRQALESSRTALKATEAGYEVGTRTAVDVLDARKTLVQAETNYSRSRYDYILNVLNLRLAAGTLDRSAVEEVNSWLEKSAPIAPIAPIAPVAPTAAAPAKP